MFHIAVGFNMNLQNKIIHFYGVFQRFKKRDNHISFCFESMAWNQPFSEKVFIFKYKSRMSQQL